MRRAGQVSPVLTAWLEQQIEALVDLPEDFLRQAEVLKPFDKERMRRFREAAFSLHVEEHFSRTKRNRDRIIYSMLRCKSRSRLEELSLAIREGELDFAAAAIRFSEGPKAPKVAASDRFLPDAGHPELRDRLAKANEGDLNRPLCHR